MDLDTLQEFIHSEYEAGTDYPSSSDEDYLVRTKSINLGIRVWEQVEDTDWKELRSLNSLGDGDTTTDGTKVVDCPSDLTRIVDFVQLTDPDGYETNWEVIPHTQVETRLAGNSSAKFCYITGKKGVYKLNFSVAPTTGSTIEYPYTQTATLLSTGSDTPQMSKPLYLVYFTLTKLYLQDNRGDMVTYYEQKQQEVMAQMIIENETSPFHNQLYDESMHVDGMVWGE